MRLKTFTLILVVISLLIQKSSGESISEILDKMVVFRVVVDGDSRADNYQLLGNSVLLRYNDRLFLCSGFESTFAKMKTGATCSLGLSKEHVIDQWVDVESLRENFFMNYDGLCVMEIKEASLQKSDFEKLWSHASEIANEGPELSMLGEDLYHLGMLFELIGDNKIVCCVHQRKVISDNWQSKQSNHYPLTVVSPRLKINGANGAVFREIGNSKNFELYGICVHSKYFDYAQMEDITFVIPISVVEAVLSSHIGYQDAFERRDGSKQRTDDVQFEKR